MDSFYCTRSLDTKAKSTVNLTKQGYDVHVESKDTKTVFDAVFKPETEPSPVFNSSYESYKIINWLVASPKMRVTGTLTINKETASEKTYKLQDVRGYHDHNWGYWLWQDDLGWDWGQASASKMRNYPGEEKKGTYKGITSILMYTHAKELAPQ